jgi:predicted TIM-barrel fold metal-dependent hydrolase
MFLGRILGGSFEDPALLNSLTPAAAELLQAAFAPGIEVYDHHSHLGGLGTNGSGCCVNDVMLSPLRHPINYIKYQAFSCAAGVDPASPNFDQEYVARLVRLVDTIRPRPWRKHFLLAMDQWYDPDGRVRVEKTGLFVPNEYVMKVAAAHPTHFNPVISVHPYRADAVQELEKHVALGVRMVKWLPNSQGMDASLPICQRYFQAMARLNMVLLCHVGEEHSIDAGYLQNALGNPLLLRYPLDAGVKVIAAHCASEGTCSDLDAPGHPRVDAFDLFLRLMDDPKYKQLLFADISAMIGFKRLGKPLTTMLNRTDLHANLVYGSDYPVPCINIVVQTKALVSHGYITEQQREYLNEIYKVNPLVFDFATKRTLCSPDQKKKFSESVFSWNERLFGPPF